MRYKCFDIAFLLIVRFDTIDRLENTLLISEFLSTHFETNIYLWEFSAYDNGIFRRLAPKGVKYTFNLDDNPILHRTRYLNEMVKRTKEKFVSIWDVDVIAPVCQIVKSIELLRSGVDFVLPYEKVCYDTSKEIRKYFYKERNIDFLLQNSSFMNEFYPPNCVGGAFFANRLAYIQSGLEKEQFYGWGVEDGERYRRWNIQKQKIERVKGPLFHLTHDRGVNSVILSEESRLTKRRIFRNSIVEELWKT